MSPKISDEIYRMPDLARYSCEIFDGALTPYKDIRLKNDCYQAYMDPIQNLYKTTSDFRKCPFNDCYI